MAGPSEAVGPGSLGERSGTTGAMRLSDELDGWLRSDGDKTLGSLIDLFEERSFAVAVAGIVVLLAGVVLEIVVGWAALEGLGRSCDLRVHTRVRPHRERL